MRGNMNKQQIHDEIARKLVGEGKLIEAGWQIMRAICLPPDASASQIREMRKAFFMGAQHLFTSMMGILEPAEEPTDADLARMELIYNELESFKMEVTSNYHPGNA